MNKNNETKQFGILEIVLYHLIPGLPILLLSIFFSNPIWGLGLSIYLSLMLAILFGLIPTQLCILFITAKNEGKRLSDVIEFKEPMPVGRMLLWAIPCLVIAFLVFGVVAPIEHPLWSIFNWVPDWFRINLFSITAISKAEAIVCLVLGITLNGILGPFVEELYFRGFLLPRMGKLGKLAPLTNAVLFSLYHFFTPWENITRIIALIPYISVVYLKKNIRIGMIVHLSLNTLSMIGMALLFLTAK